MDREKRCIPSQKPIKGLDHLTEHDLKQVIEWNQSPPDHVPSCVHNLIEQRAQSQPHAPAVHSWDGAVTYASLTKLSAHLALHLVKLGVGVEILVPLCFEKSMWAVVSMLAVHKAGGAAVFLDSSHPMDRIQSMLQDMDAAILLCSPCIAPKFKNHAIEVLEVTEFFIDRIDVASCLQLPVVQPSNAAIGLFTSGSTGKPKGIIQEHRTAAFSAQTCAKTFGIKSGSRVLQWASYSFDMSVIDMLMTLIGGGCVCIPSDKDRMDNLAESMRDMSVDCAAMTPSVARTVKSANLPSLRTLVFGGEPVSKGDIEGWSDTMKIINGYGPGEASVCVAGDASTDCPAKIGKAIGSVTWIVDESNHNYLAPVGAVGELLIEGPLLARGYLRDPVKTSAGFIENPPWLAYIRGTDGRARRLYRTGDLARYDSDGTIVFIGRRDTQVKLRGQRIEAAEIEHHLHCCLPSDMSVAVDIIVPAGGPNTSKLAAFVGLDSKAEAVEEFKEALTDLSSKKKRHLLQFFEGLEKRLSKSLPAYMIPSYIVPLRQMPLTASGKIDRKMLIQLGSRLTALQLLDLTRMDDRQRQEQIRSREMEQRMRELWATILPIDPQTIEPSYDFFKLGGDSINAMQLAGAANASNIKLTTRQIFQQPTLASMSLAAIVVSTSTEELKKCEPSTLMSTCTENFDVDKLGGDIGNLRLIHDKPDIEDIIEAPDMQAFMAICGLLESHGYINYFSFDLTGPIDLKRLETSCRSLVSRHSSLRTTFALQAGRVFQVILKSYDCEFARYSSRDETEKLLASLCSKDLTCDAKLGDNIVRFLVVDRGIDHHILIMRISHAQFDGTSLSLLYRDLQMAYQGQDLPKPPQYVDFARAVKATITSEAEDFWRNLLQGSSMTSILHHSKPPYKNVINDRVSRTIPYKSIQEQGITLATLIKAAWAVVLANMSSESDVVFGHAVSGRNLSLDGIDRIVGDCNNAVLVRVKLYLATSVLDLLVQIRDQIVAAMPYESIGPRQLIEKRTNWPRWTRYSSSVNHQNYADAGMKSFRMGDAQCNVTYADLEVDRRDVQIYSYLPQGGQMKLEMAFCNRAIPRSVMEGMLGKLCDAVQRFSADVHAPLVFSTKSDDLPFIKIPLMAENEKKSSEVHRARPRPRNFAFALLDPRAIIERVWKKFEAIIEAKVLAEFELGSDTPFYEIGGDLVYAAQLSTFYQEEGISLAMEDIIDHPTKRTQTDFLAFQLHQ